MVEGESQRYVFAGLGSHAQALAQLQAPSFDQKKRQAAPVMVQVSDRTMVDTFV